MYYYKVHLRTIYYLSKIPPSRWTANLPFNVTCKQFTVAHGHERGGRGSTRVVSAVHVEATSVVLRPRSGY